MQYLSGDEWLFYGGMVIMALSVVLTVICIGIFIVSGRIIKRQLEQEYGKAMQ